MIAPAPGDPSLRGPASGMRTVNRAPPSGASTTSIRPPWRSTMPYETNSPSPVPPSRAGEERLEDAVADRRVDAGSPVADLEHAVRPFAADRDHDRLPLVHGLERVRHEVQRHLVELGGVAEDGRDGRELAVGPRRARAGSPRRRRCARRRPRGPRGPRGRGRARPGLATSSMPAHERESAVGGAARPCRGPRGTEGSFGCPRARSRRTPTDAAEQVVELVGEPARERAEARHLRRLHEPVLRRLAAPRAPRSAPTACGRGRPSSRHLRLEARASSGGARPACRPRPARAPRARRGASRRRADRRGEVARRHPRHGGAQARHGREDRAPERDGEQRRDAREEPARAASRAASSGRRTSPPRAPRPRDEGVRRARPRGRPPRSRGARRRSRGGRARPSRGRAPRPRAPGAARRRRRARGGPCRGRA